MHQVRLDDDIMKIALQRRGRLRLFETIDPKRTAHLVIDMQAGFMTPGAPAEIAPAASVIPNINRISAACREAGALNVFIQNSINEESKKSWSNWFEAFWTPDKREGMYATFAVDRRATRSSRSFLLDRDASCSLKILSEQDARDGPA